MRRTKFSVFLCVVVLICFSFGSCMTASNVPDNATPEEIELANAKNLEAIAANTATLTGITIITLIVGIVSGIVSGFTASINNF